MDAFFHLMLTGLKEIDGLIVDQKIYNWDGVDYPQEPIIYRWGRYVEIVPSQTPEYLYQLLPEGYKEKAWIGFDIQGECLDRLENEVNGEDVEWFGKSLEDILFAILTSQDRWVLIFEPSYDTIDNIYILEAVQCIQKLKEVLLWQNRTEGIIVLPSQAVKAQSIFNT